MRSSRSLSLLAITIAIFSSPITTNGTTLLILTNFILMVAGVSAMVLLLRSDVKQSAAIFRRNVKHIRHRLEEESSAASKLASFRSLYSYVFVSASSIFLYEINFPPL
ncbi:hypothetical protein SLE2022_348210 [Rubroshorea leprosula]